MAAQAMKQAQKEGKTLAEATEIYRATLARLLSGNAKDAFQVTSVGMHKVAEAKKFIDVKVAQAHDAVPYDFVPKAQKSLSWQISDLDEKIRGIEMKYGRSNSKLPGLRKKLKALHEARKFIDAHIMRGKDTSWGSAALMPMNYKKAAETANTQAREHRVEGKRISMAKGSLKPEFTAAAQAHYTAAGCWDDIVNALKQRSDAGEEAAESLWGSAVRQGQKAELLTAQLGIVTKAYDSLSFNTLFWAGIIAALIAKHYGPKETVGMGSYDLRTYQPERKTW
jgi:hypothetical protein